jgi:hypothetical protein
MPAVSRTTPDQRNRLAQTEAALTEILGTVDSAFYATAQTRAAYQEVIDHLGTWRHWAADAS